MEELRLLTFFSLTNLVASTSNLPFIRAKQGKKTKTKEVFGAKAKEVVVATTLLQ